MKSVTIFLVSLVLGSTAVFAETKQEQYEKYQKMMKETLSQSAENTKKSNIHLNDNIRVTFLTDPHKPLSHINHLAH